jgi:hypothetical protein
VTGDGGAGWKVGIKSSVTAKASFWMATGTNWTRILRTTDTGAPASTDICYIVSEIISAANGAARTVTMDETVAARGNTPANDYGGIELGGPEGYKGTLHWLHAATTNYAMKQSGNINVWQNGAYEQGKSGHVVPATSYADLRFDCTTNVEFGLKVYGNGIATGQGTTLHTVESALLSTDTANGDNHFHVPSDPGWLAGETVGIASTSRTRTDCKSRVVGAGGSVAGSVPVTVNFDTVIHSGTAPTKGEVVNLVRNVSISGASASLQAYIDSTLALAGALTFDFVEFYWLGSATAGKDGIATGTITGSTSITNCSLHDFAVTGSDGFTVSGATANNITFSTNVVYNMAGDGVAISAATSGTTITVSGNIIILCGLGNHGIYLADLGGTITNNTCVGCGYGINLSESGGTIGTMSGHTCHSDTVCGFYVTCRCAGTITNLTLWRNSISTGGLAIYSNGTYNLIIDTAVIFGNGSYGIHLGTLVAGLITFKNLTVNAGVTLTQPIGLRIALGASNVLIQDSTFGETTGHATGDIQINAGSEGYIVMHDVVLAGPVEIVSQASMMAGFAVIRSGHHDATPNTNDTFKREGNLTSDTQASCFRTASPSVRMTPLIATEKLKSTAGAHPRGHAFFAVAVNSGQVCTPSVYVRRSLVGDGAAYNGNAPELYVRQNLSAGIVADALLATAATPGTPGDWVQMTAPVASPVSESTVLEFYVTCDGTAGWVNADDFTAAVA